MSVSATASLSSSESTSDLSSGQTDAAAKQGHPAGLYLLFFTEMWERFSFYGMRALLVLYLVAGPDRGGFGWNQTDALHLYGWYIGLAYLTPMFGGFMADRFLGQRKSIMFGGTLMIAGHFLMAFPGAAAFYGALALLIFGNGFFKPNISTMVGKLYKDGDPRRDGAFTIFYMGINIGAFAAPLVCGTLGEKVGYHWGFAAAGVGMTLGVILFALLSQRFLGDIGKLPTRTAATEKAAATPLTKDEVDRVSVIIVLSAFTIFFWATFEQAGGLMNLYTDAKVDRFLFGWEVPTTWFQSVNSFFIITLGPIFAWLWTSLGRRGKEPPTPAKFAFGLMTLSIGFVAMVFAAKQSEALGKAHMGWVIAAYMFHTIGELCVSPVGLSAVTKLAPLKFASLMMGVWFLSNAIADKLSGTIGAYSEKLGEVQVFGGIAVVTFVGGLVLLSITKPLVVRMHGRA
jgi:POT family proton-dependent oligopeptide transporter